MVGTEASHDHHQTKVKAPRRRRWVVCWLLALFTGITIVVAVTLYLYLLGLFGGSGCHLPTQGASWGEDCKEGDSAGNDTAPQVFTSSPATVKSLNDTKVGHRPKKLTTSKLLDVARLVDIDRFMGRERLDPLLEVRVSGTPGNARVRQHIVSSLQGLGAWNIEQDRFTDWTPHTRDQTEFVNVVATLSNSNGQPESDLKLVLACHYDSKYFSQGGFVGATDSSVPCAMLLDLAHNLDSSLKARTFMPYTLQLIFFDGEEAFQYWSDTDSLYGSRHLAQKWQNAPHHSKKDQNVLDGIGLFVLLDLIGGPRPQFKNHFSANPQSNRMYKHLQNIENRLQREGRLARHSNDGPYFSSNLHRGTIADDHKPFLERGVDVVHVIATPFPRVWHTMDDNKLALDRGSISDLSKIFHVFVAEFLHLPPPARQG